MSSLEPYKLSDGRNFEGFLNEMKQYENNQDQFIDPVEQKLEEMAAKKIEDIWVVTLEREQLLQNLSKA